ncbi:MAG: ATP-binding protein [Chloroflexota bacterium]
MEIIEQTQSKLSVLAQVKNLTLIWNVSEDLPEIIVGDLNRLQQILVNLVSNAIKFTETGSISTSFYSPDPGFWAMSVSDTGIGIPPEAQTFIFEPFRQVDGSATRKQAGTGLGLSIVKQLTDLMQGEIILKSKVGQGSTFTVILPLVVEDIS